MRSEAFTAAQLTGRADAQPTLSALGNKATAGTGASGAGKLGFAAVMAATDTIKSGARTAAPAFATGPVPNLSNAQAAMFLTEPPAKEPVATITAGNKAAPQTVQQEPVKTAMAQTPEAPVHKNRFSTSRTAGSMPVWEPKPDLATQATSLAPGLKEPETTINTGARPPMGFGDFVDMVNPLQHIPLVGTLYRHVTGDTISPAARMMGGTLYGGPVGAVASMVSVAVEDRTGKDLAENMIDATFKSRTAASSTVAEDARFNAMLGRVSQQG